MIKRVYGSVEGVEVIFTPTSDENVWECAVPMAEDGEYVIELYAEDEAGNKAYAATMLFAIDLKHLLFEVKWIQFAEQAESKRFVIDGRVKDYSLGAVKCGIGSYEVQSRMTDFKMVLTRCEVCGGDPYANR